MTKTNRENKGCVTLPTPNLSVFGNASHPLPSFFENLAVHFSSATNEWETPQAFYDKLNDEFGFTLDPCATPENAKCDKYFTETDNGLEQDWTGHVVFMNPPYGRAIGKWVEKAYRESQKGALVVCLIPARTDTAYWHDYAIKGDVRFVRGRLRFGGR